MKNLTYTVLLLTTTFSLAFVPACSGSDTETGDGDSSGDGDASGTGGAGTATGGAGTATGGAGAGTGGAGAGTGGAGVGTGGAGVGTGGAGVGTGGADVGTGGADVGSGGAGTGGESSQPSAECIEYCGVWFDDCNDVVDADMKYADEAACLTACGSFATPVGTCRLDHVKYVAGQGTDHCDHSAAAPSAPCSP